MNETKSRTNNSIINSTFSMFNQIIILILQFVLKTVFINVLGSEYLGINGLFTNIVLILSLADLGIGIGIPYSLYKPLAENDTQKIKALMNFYSKLYTVIGIIVLIIGLSIMPFLDFFIEGDTNVENIQIIYFLFILNSACSYFFVYKKLLIEADQKGYILTKIILLFNIILTVLQIAILLIFKNYIFYLVTNIVIVFVQNIVISNKCNKLYPYIKEKNEVQKLEKSDYKEIKKNISSLFIYKLGAAFLNGTDNIIISKILGIVVVGIYSNYLMIYNAVVGVVSQVFNALTASIGNLVVTTNERKSEEIFNVLNFFNFWLYGTIGICLVSCINPFINLWVGQEFILSSATTFVIILNLYIYGMQSVTTSYKNAYGLFKQGRYYPIIMLILNITISIVLAKRIGILGIVLGTALSRLLTTVWHDPFIIYKYKFKTSFFKYCKKYFTYLATFIIIAFAAYNILDKITIDNFMILIIMALVVFLVANVIFIILFGRTPEFKYLYEIVKQKVKSIINIIERKRNNNVTSG